MDVLQTVRDIKALKIQGAAPIAKAALLALQEEAHQSKATTVRSFLKDIRHAEHSLAAARPTEPYLRNLLRLTTATLSSTS